jgi:FkbM family methyltransferase
MPHNSILMRILGRFKVVRNRKGVKDTGLEQEWNVAGLRDESDFDRFRMICAIALYTDSIYIDIGANQGRYLTEAISVSRIKSSDTYAFEANPTLAEKLKLKFENVHQVALADYEGFANFSICNFDGLSSFEKSASRSYPYGSEFTPVNVEVKKLDNYKFPKRVRLIKIDVEGAEFQVINGALNTIREHRPMIFFEHGPDSTEFHDIDVSISLFQLLVSLDYTILTVDGELISNLDHWLEIYKYRPIWNYLLLPN